MPQPPSIAYSRITRNIEPPKKLPHPPYPHLTSHLSAIPCTIALVVPYEYYPWSNLSKAAALYTQSLGGAGEQLFTERPKQPHQLQGADTVGSDHNSHHIPLSYDQLPCLET